MLLLTETHNCHWNVTYRKGSSPKLLFSFNIFFLHSGQASGSWNENIFAWQCWTHSIPGSDNIFTDYCGNLINITVAPLMNKYTLIWLFLLREEYTSRWTAPVLLAHAYKLNYHEDDSALFCIHFFVGNYVHMCVWMFMELIKCDESINKLAPCS